jgi:protein-L-isoaspartate(D-aspartate) O-methyltransferase
MNFTEKRAQMVADQLEARDITDPRVLEAFRQVPREEFVPDLLKDNAYSDFPLPLGEGQTISQPYIVAKICQLLMLTGNEKILDVGTGSGYQAAILSHLAREVITLERIEALASRAKSTLERLNFENVRVFHKDAKEGMASEAPFDAVKSAAAATQVPRAWKDQLSVGGRIVLPLEVASRHQLVRISKTKRGFITERLEVVNFVPLV